MKGSTAIRVVPLATKLLLQTNGVDANPVVTDIVLPDEVEAFGPHLAGITAQTGLEQKSANFQWKGLITWSIDGGKNWEAFSDLFAWQTAVERKIQTEFADKTKFGIRIRFALSCSPSAGTALERGLVTVVLVFRFTT